LTHSLSCTPATNSSIAGDNSDGAGVVVALRRETYQMTVWRGLLASARYRRISGRQNVKKNQDCKFQVCLKIFQRFQAIFQK